MSSEIFFLLNTQYKMNKTCKDYKTRNRKILIVLIMTTLVFMAVHEIYFFISTKFI